jgi:hypothetical protein
MYLVKNKINRGIKMSNKTSRSALALFVFMFLVSVSITGCNSYKECKKESIPVQTVEN